MPEHGDETPAADKTGGSAPFALTGPLVLVGAGKMGGAMLTGLLENGFPAANVRVQDPTPPPDMKTLLSNRGIAPETGPLRLDTPAGVIVLAVKPQVMADVLPTVAPLAGAETLVLTIAAGKPLSLYENAFPAGTAIIRAMPNTPAAIGRGVTGLIANTAVTDEQRHLAETILSALGAVVWLPGEDQMDALTAVSGSGPAYVFHLVEALAEAGRRAGLPEGLAMDLARQTVSGAGALLDADPNDAGTLRRNVTSPGGTTEAALKILMRESNGLTELMTEAVAAARTRSRDLAN